jgi:hypothetical protein
VLVIVNLFVAVAEFGRLPTFVFVVMFVGLLLVATDTAARELNSSVLLLEMTELDWL